MVWCECVFSFRCSLWRKFSPHLSHCCTMTKRGIIATLVMLVVSLVHSDTPLDGIITGCIAKSKRFASTEKKYVDTNKVEASDPLLTGPPNEVLEAAVYLIEKRQRPFECITDHMDSDSLPDLETNPKYRALVHECKSKQSHPPCDPSYPYRTYDGTCNNLMHPRYGSVFNCLRRLVDANYIGAAGMRQSVCGEPLPEPRYLSLTIFKDVDRSYPCTTQMTSFFGQFLAHDITDVPNTSIDAQPIDCCSKGKKLHPQCAPIYIKKNDPFYSKHNITCFNFNRAAMCDTCSVGKRSQMNQQTAYLDLSQTYGATDYVAESLRVMDGSGKLKTQQCNASCNLMPLLTEDEKFFISGDRRANQHTTLISLHTVWLREHNRIAEILHDMNPHWDEEMVFQQARKINIAQYQAIVYGEHLQPIVGTRLMKSFDLNLAYGLNRTVYKPSVDATLFGEFNTAGYRLHSTINKFVGNSEVDGGKLWFRNTSANPMPLYEDKLSSLMKGVCQASTQKYDRFVTTELTDFLYKEMSGNYGFDIASLNIHRGRECGLPTYTELVNHLYNDIKKIENFRDLRIFMDKENIATLQRNYCDVKDIDLWVGLNNERLQKGIMVGPTAAMLTAIQFRNLKLGDRWYFEHSGNFDDRQLQTLKRASLSGVLCSNSHIKTIQLLSHRFACERNPIRSCEDIPKINLLYWKDTRKVFNE